MDAKSASFERGNRLGKVDSGWWIVGILCGFGSSDHGQSGLSICRIGPGFVLKPAITLTIGRLFAISPVQS